MKQRLKVAYLSDHVSFLVDSDRAELYHVTLKIHSYCQNRRSEIAGNDGGRALYYFFLIGVIYPLRLQRGVAFLTIALSLISLLLLGIIIVDKLNLVLAGYFFDDLWHHTV